MTEIALHHALSVDVDAAQSAIALAVSAGFVAYDTIGIGNHTVIADESALDVAIRHQGESDETSSRVND
ncbi:MAG: hypothetical protein AAGF11_36090 [Myxococcota bacterium]